MSTFPLPRALHDQPRRDEGPIGLSAAFAGLVWGILMGGLLNRGLPAIVEAGSAGALLATVGVAVRQIVLARAALSPATR